MVYGNLPDARDIHYDKMTTHNWNAKSGDERTVPLGAGVSKMVALRRGLGIESLLGYHDNVSRPQGATHQVIE